MDSDDVEGIIEKAADHRLSLKRAITIAWETCRGFSPRAEVSPTGTSNPATCGSLETVLPRSATLA